MFITIWPTIGRFWLESSRQAPAKARKSWFKFFRFTNIIRSVFRIWAVLYLFGISESKHESNLSIIEFPWTFSNSESLFNTRGIIVFFMKHFCAFVASKAVFRFE